MKAIIHWFVAAIAIIIAAYLIPAVTVNGLVTALVVAIVLGGLNLVIKPLLVLLTLPVNVVTLGLFTIIINAFLVWLANLIVPGFRVANFGWAIVFAIVLSVVSLVFKTMQSSNNR